MRSPRPRSLPGAMAKGGLAMTVGIVVGLAGLARPAWSASDEVAALQAAFLRGEYRRVVQQTAGPVSRRPSDDLLYLRGMSALKLQDWETARSCLTRLIEEYPDSRLAGQARLGIGSIDQVEKGGGEKEEGFFTVQVGAFSAEGNALRMKRALARRGHEAQVSPAFSQGKALHKVRVGRFSSRTEAEEKARQLEQDGFPGRVFP